MQTFIITTDTPFEAVVEDETRIVTPIVYCNDVELGTGIVFTDKAGESRGWLAGRIAPGDVVRCFRALKIMRCVAHFQPLDERRTLLNCYYAAGRNLHRPSQERKEKLMRAIGESKLDQIFHDPVMKQEAEALLGGRMKKELELLIGKATLKQIFDTPMTEQEAEALLRGLAKSGESLMYSSTDLHDIPYEIELGYFPDIPIVQKYVRGELDQRQSKQSH